MLEVICENDDVLLEKYFNGQPLSVEELKASLRASTLSLKVTPVLCGSAFKNKGVQLLLDAVVDYLPSPEDLPPVVGTTRDGSGEVVRKADDSEPFAALVFKIMTDSFVGQLAFFRVYSGMMKSGSYVYNSAKDSRERVDGCSKCTPTSGRRSKTSTRETLRPRLASKM